MSKKKIINVCSVFPMLTPLEYSRILQEQQPKVKHITTRMAGSYKKNFKKRK